MKKLYIVSGANGSGKTTFAKMLTEDLSLPFVNADEIAKELDPSIRLVEKWKLVEFSFSK